MTHEERLKIARTLADRIVEAHGDAILAVYVTSSTARGLDRDHSDLELTAVHQDGREIEDKSYIYGEILIEIEYVAVSRLLQQARRVTRGWAITANGYRSRIVLFERDRWLRHLEEAVGESEAADRTKAMALAMTAVIETRDKIRNYIAGGDHLNVRVHGVWLTESAARLVLLLNWRYMLTTAWLYRQAFECPDRPPDFQRQIEILAGVPPATPQEIAAIAERLTADLLAMVRVRGVEVESAELLI